MFSSVIYNQAFLEQLLGSLLKSCYSRKLLLLFSTLNREGIKLCPFNLKDFVCFLMVGGRGGFNLTHSKLNLRIWRSFAV